MADKVTGNHLRYPSNPHQVYEESKVGLNTGPCDKPEWRARQGQEQVTSTRMPLGREAHPVAAYGAHPSKGNPTEQTTSTRMPINKSAASPYDPISRTKPEVPLKVRGK